MMLETAANSSINVTGTLGSAININPWADGLERWIAARTGLSPSVSDVVTALILLAAFLILSRISRHFVTDVAPHLVSKTGSTLDDELLKALKGPIQALIIVIGVYLACKSLNNLPSLIIFVLDKLASVMLILVGAYFVSNVVNALIQWYVNDLAPKTGSDMDDHLMPFLRKFLVVSIYVIALVMVIGLFTEITPLLAGLGVFGIAIAFAAKEALSNLFGAFAILTDRPYKEGDRLFVKGVGTGDVMEMGMRSTRVKTLDNHIVIIPNERLAAGRIVNLSQPDKKIRLELKFGVGYTADSYKSDLDVADSIYRKALVAFKKEGIEIPYPTMSVKPK